MVQIVLKKSKKCCILSTVACWLSPMRCVIVFGKCKKLCKGLLGGRRKFEAARFGHLLRSDILQYILVQNLETKFHDALLRISRNLVFVGRKPL